MANFLYSQGYLELKLAIILDIDRIELGKLISRKIAKKCKKLIIWPINGLNAKIWQEKKRAATSRIHPAEPAILAVRLLKYVKK